MSSDSPQTMAELDQYITDHTATAVAAEKNKYLDQIQVTQTQAQTANQRSIENTYAGLATGALPIGVDLKGQNDQVRLYDPSYLLPQGGIDAPAQPNLISSLGDLIVIGSIIKFLFFNKRSI